MATPTNSNGNLVEEFEEAFQRCLNVLTKDESCSSNDKDEIKIEVDQTISLFIDMARQMEAFFLQKRFLLSTLKPELVIKEDICDLRVELARKDELLRRHYDKIAVWQNLLADLQGYSKTSGTTGTMPSTSGLANGGGLTPTQGAMPSQSGLQVGQPSTNPMGMPGGPAGLPTSTLHQVQMHQQQMQFQQQQQQMQVHLQQQQIQAQLQQQQMHVSPQALFMQQQASASGRGGPSGFGPGGPGGGQGASAGVLQGPLAYLEKTASNIDFAGMADGRR